MKRQPRKVKKTNNSDINYNPSDTSESTETA